MSDGDLVERLRRIRATWPYNPATHSWERRDEGGDILGYVTAELMLQMLPDTVVPR